jgi:tRNA (guanine37-N1)-methyltransferase
LRKRLKRKLGDIAGKTGDGLYNSFDVIGDIAIIKIPAPSTEKAKAVALAILKGNKGVKTVLTQTSKVEGAYRLRKLSCIGGENKTRTVHKEHGCIFATDVETCYFSPRLSGERLRITKLVQSNETVVNMFAGVGCFSILIAKRVPSAKVYSIDINPAAVEFMAENIRVNRVYSKVTPLLGDAKNLIETQLQSCADRVLMPLPEKAFEYLPTAIKALKPSGGWVHVHAFEHATKTQNAADSVKAKIANILIALGVAFEFGVVREVRSIGPNWFQIVADVRVFSASDTHMQ